ncbi:hypothetical protein ACLOJK_020615 [Asimina triloba]
MAKPSKGRTAEETVTPRRQAARSLTRAWKGHKLKSRNKGGSQKRAKEEPVGFLTNKTAQGCKVADDGGAAGIDDLKKASRGFPHTGYASCQKRLPMAAIATRNSSKIPLGQQTRLLRPVER